MPKSEPALSGHNTAVIKSKLEGYIKRVEKLLEDRKAVNDDIKEVMDEAKANGFEKKMLKEMIKLRAMDSDKRTQLEELRDMYIAALGLC